MVVVVVGVIFAIDIAVNIPDNPSPRPRSVVLKMCSLDQQHGYHSGTY